MARKLVETVLQEWLEGILPSATVVYTHPHAPEPAVPFVRLQVDDVGLLGMMETYMDADGLQNVLQHRMYDVVVELVGDTAREMADTVVARSALDSSALSDDGASIEEIERIGTDRVRLGQAFELRSWLELRVSARELWTEETATVGGVNVVEATGTIDDLVVVVEATAGD